MPSNRYVVQENSVDNINNIIEEDSIIIDDDDEYNDVNANADDVNADDVACAICLCYSLKKEVITLKCKHKFHSDCIKKWLLTQEKIRNYDPNESITLEGSCPLCRKKISYIFISDKDDESFNVKIPYSILFIRLIWKYMKIF